MHSILRRRRIRRYMIGRCSRSIPSGDALNSRNVVGALQAGNVVILRGLYNQAGQVRTLWMLATSFTVDSAGAVTGILADESSTGGQVRIDPVRKVIVSPANFPLPGLRVNAYRVVTLK